ncbi:MAG: hypothetical protein KDC12_10440 [Flavobacteriales bacterium]|nr:hypothetical protein [Flavobacteriales bacterium]
MENSSQLGLVLKVILGCALVVIVVVGLLARQRREQQNRIRNRSRFNKRKFN